MRWYSWIIAIKTIHSPDKVDAKADDGKKETNRCQSIQSGKQGGWRREKRATDRQWRVPLYPRHDSALTTAHPFTIGVTDATHDRSDLIWTYSIRSFTRALRISAAFFFDLRPLFFSLVTQHESLFTQRSCCLFLPRRQTRSRSSEREAQLRFGNRTPIRPHCRPIVLKRYTTPMEVSCKFGVNRNRWYIYRWEKRFTANEINRYNTRCTFALLRFMQEWDSLELIELKLMQMWRKNVTIVPLYLNS